MKTLPKLLMLGLILSSPRAVEATDWASWNIRLQPFFSPGVAPAWASGMTNGPLPHPESDSIDIPLPALAAQEEVGCFAATIVFDDNGDGGPVVEWLTPSGESILLSAGLGDMGIALGANARTLLLPQTLTLDGGTLRLSFAGRFGRLRSATLSPARELGVAALESGSTPALITPGGRVFSDNQVSGAGFKPGAGDKVNGMVVSAEISAASFRLDSATLGDSTEFILPITGSPLGSVMKAEIGGLDPESRIEVSVNGEFWGFLAPLPPDLNGAETLVTDVGRLAHAGWHPSRIFLPGRLFKQGDNSIVLALHRGPGDQGGGLFIRELRCDLLFNATPSPPGSTPEIQVPIPKSPPVVDQQHLSNGSLYGNPSPGLFRNALPLPGGS